MCIRDRVLTGWGIIPNMIIGLLLAALTWVAAWRYIMPRMVKADYSWRSPALWKDSLIYPAINTVALLGASSIVGLLYLASGNNWTIWILALLILIIVVGIPVVFAIPSVVYLLRKGWYKFNATKSRVEFAFFVVVITSNIVYLLLSLGYTALIGAF